VLLLVGHDRLEALAILEAVVLECKKREIDARNVKAALDFLEPYIRPQWLIPQYRDHMLGHDRTTQVALEGQQQCFALPSPYPRFSPRSARSTNGRARS
jgi:hypothetical protein